MTLVSVVFHALGLILIVRVLKFTSTMTWPKAGLQKDLLTLVCGMLGIVVLHMLEAVAWAVLYLWVGEFSDMTRALYFSMTTSTTLGYGDLTLSPQWQVLSTFEAMTGLLLFGASTALMLALMKRLIETEIQA